MCVVHQFRNFYITIRIAQ